jgi:RNA polymerase sigma-70 factor (ECF subfamily)
VLESLDRFRGESTFKTWLFRLAHNHLSNLRRRFRTHLDERADALPEEVLEGLQDGSAELPDASIVKDEQCRVLERCLALLPEVERGVIIGQYYEDVTLEELTARFKLTNRSGARASLIAAQRKLRRCMEQAGLGNGTRAGAKGRS